MSIQTGTDLETALTRLAEVAPDRLTLAQALFFVMVASRADAQDGLTVSEARRLRPLGVGLKKSHATLVAAGLIRRSNSVEERDGRFRLTDGGQRVFEAMLGRAGPN